MNYEAEQLDTVQRQRENRKVETNAMGKRTNVPVKAPSTISCANSFRVTPLHHQQSRAANPFFYFWLVRRPPSRGAGGAARSSRPPVHKVRVTCSGVSQVSGAGIVTRGFWARCLGTSRRRLSACGPVSRCCGGWTLAVYWRSRSSSESRSRPDGRRHSVTLVHTQTHTHKQGVWICCMDTSVRPVCCLQHVASCRF